MTTSASSYFASTQSNSYLFGDLTKVVDEADGGGLLERVVDVVDVHLALVEEVVEHVDRLHGWWALLLVAKDEVDPLMQVGAHIVTLQGLGRGTEPKRKGSSKQSGIKGIFFGRDRN